MGKRPDTPSRKKETHKLGQFFDTGMWICGKYCGKLNGFVILGVESLRMQKTTTRKILRKNFA